MLNHLIELKIMGFYILKSFLVIFFSSVQYIFHSYELYKEINSFWVAALKIDILRLILKKK